MPIKNIPATIILPLLLTTAISNATVLIGNGVNNGEVNEPATEWTATNTFFQTSGAYTSALTSGPFGVQTPGSSSFYLSSDFGATFVSSPFSLNAGDDLILAYDYASQHVNSVSMFFTLIGPGVSQVVDSFTSFGISTFALHQAAATFTGPTGNYQLQITYAPSDTAADVELDRIHLATVPEPSSALLLCGGLGLALLRRKRLAA